MGSYAGGSDWDDVPSVSDAATFKPRAAGPSSTPADDEVAVDGASRAKPLDLILAFDVTGSMSPWIQNVREKIDYLAQGLLKLLDARIGLIGVGDHCDGPFLLQPHALTGDLEALRRSVQAIRSTSGGDFPEGFECLFKHLNEDARWTYDRPTVLVLITDSVPHGMNVPGDAGCPDGVDARAELRKLLPKLRSFYLVNCGNHAASIAIQRTLVKSENYFLQLENFRRLTNLVMAVCMDEVGELDFFMDMLEKQRGKDRRAEVQALLKK